MARAWEAGGDWAFNGDGEDEHGLDLWPEVRGTALVSAKRSGGEGWIAEAVLKSTSSSCFD